MSISTRKMMRTFTARKNRGQTIVEFACILPILLILTMLIIQYGILLNTRLSLYHVARNAGRYAAVYATRPGIDDDIKTYTVNVANSFGLTIVPSNINFYRYPEGDTSYENTLQISSNRVQYKSLKVSITYDARQKIFLPTTYFGVRVYSGIMAVDNVVMME